MTISKSTLFAAVLFSSVTAVASAGNLDVVNELTTRSVVIHGDKSLSREAVKADFLAAQANGDLIVGENGETARDLNPRFYPARAVPIGTGKTRAEVRAELVAAQQAGDIVVGESGETARELNAKAYRTVSSPVIVAAKNIVASKRSVRANDVGYFGI